MFGYLQIRKSELKVREYDAYKSVYCGLCRQLGKDYSFLTRLILSYDCTFYAMLLMSLERSCTGFRDGKCCCNPLKKCKFAHCTSDSYAKASAFSVITAYYKLKDDLLDSGFFKRVAVRMVMPVFSHWHKKAAKHYPTHESIIAETMNRQYEAEHSGNRSIDYAAHPTANMVAEIFALEGKMLPINVFCMNSDIIWADGFTSLTLPMTWKKIKSKRILILLLSRKILRMRLLPRS